MNYARRDFVRVFHPTAEELYNNRPINGGIKPYLSSRLYLAFVAGTFMGATIFQVLEHLS